MKKDYSKITDAYVRQSGLHRVLVIQPNGDNEVAFKTKAAINDSLDRGQNLRVPSDI